ncbi:glycosyltransferase family 2 protein [Maribacter confluentis]|uniref:Glycosyltransferase family 2 protein n=1 Tax=Maribacter confluentis TaxID=1656093 RepID=A0ABT8RPY2_9FLAO|nr:glycosyltransferase family 2 protein [Maribacter confluentis]MDO1512947.1 glycosyltransferase family 2 protein [Maribacter confluentis]
MRVSVCMATYNGEKYLRAQLDSILQQLDFNDELIISDDGSTDNTLKIIESYKDSRIKVYYSKFKNIVLNFENALKHASGDVVLLSDQDDIWMDNKVEIILSHLKTHSMVFSNVLVFKDGDVNNANLFFKDSKRKTGFFNNLYKSNIIGASMAFKKSTLDKALPFPKELPMHDIWIGLIAEIIGSTYFEEEPLIYYRRHGKNASLTGEKSENSKYKMFTIRLLLVVKILKRIFRLK